MRNFDRGTKLFVVASTAAAIAVGAIYGARGWPGFPTACLVAFLAALAVGRWAEKTGLVLTLGVFYLLPALISEFHGDYYWNFNPIWESWVLGFLLSRSELTRWHAPARWRLPLIFWALIIAASWPVIVAREADFSWQLLGADGPSTNILGGAPWYVVGWVANTVLNYALGLLWLDWFFEKFRSADIGQFRRLVLIPLGLGAACACAVAVYQGLVDITWLSGGQWSTLRRAPGTFMDGDAFGAFAGWWTAAFPALALSAAASPTFQVAGVVGTLLAWGGVWASGSRMALVGGAIGLAFLAPTALGALWRNRSKRTMQAGAGIAAAAIVAVLVIGARVEWNTDSPLSRVMSALPSPTMASLEKFARVSLWNRGAPYGTASVQMVRDSPVAGSGIGTFHTMFPDYAALLGQPSAGDNAQSWYRHQLAELGIAGSLGWIVWGLSLGWLLVRGRARPGAEAEARSARGALIAIGLISAVSMPTQHFADSFTVIAFAFWYFLLVDAHALEVSPSRPPVRRAGQAAVLALVLLHVITSVYVGWTRFRPPLRALRADWDYTYGLYDPETIDGQAAQWAQRRAVAVIKAPKRWMALTFWVNFSNVQEKPIDVKIWQDEALVVRTRLRNTEPVTTYLHVRGDDRRVMLETQTSRVMVPSKLGASNDDRELGLAVRWEFIDKPPDNATVAQ